MALVAPHKWEDPYELAGNMIAAEWLEGARIKQTSITLPLVYAQCWSATPESDTLLRAYSRVIKDPHFLRNICPRDEGVLVRSTPRKLLEALLRGSQRGQAPTCFIGSVEYLERDALFGRVANAVQTGGLNVFDNPAELATLLLMKRNAFGHEAEVRLIHVGAGIDPSDSALLKIKIDPPNTVFDEISFDPRLAMFERFERVARMEKHGYPREQVRESKLYEPPSLLIHLDRPPGSTAR
jgi:hypothetical protein